MDKQEQKKLLTEIMQADERDGLYSSISKMETTQTAVEWLRSKLLIKDKELEDLFEQAKQIEKEQIIDAFDMGCEDENRIGAEYYNETYKNERQNT
jgi:hypothetical protein